MISRISGVVELVYDHRAEVRVGDLVYEVLVPAYLENSLAGKKGDQIELYTHCYLEGGQGGSAMVPRLIGFQSAFEREFYKNLIKVPGLGPKGVLRAMAAPPSDLARAIETEDAGALSSLPGIGRRTADKIIASLKGKVSQFAALGETAAEGVSLGEVEDEAVLVLLQLGYKRAEAETMVKRALKKNPSLEAADGIVQAALRDTGSGALR